MSSQVSVGSGRSRTRSRSQSLARSSTIAMRRGRIAVMAVSRSLKYNGTYSLTRTTNCYAPFTSSGFTIGGSPQLAVGIVFDPTQATIVTTSLGGSIPAAVPNYAEIASLWERVSIDKVVVTISNRLTDNSAGFGGNVSCPVFYFATDENDVANNTLAITQQQANCRRWASTSNRDDFEITVYPRYQRIVYYTAGVSSYEPARGFVVSDTAIPHYGLRIASDWIFVGSSGLNFTFKYFYSCKNVK